MNEKGKQIVELYKSGKHMGEICKELGVSKASVSYYINEAGVSRYKPPIEITEELLNQIQKRYDEIDNLAVVAKEFGVSVNRLERIARHNTGVVSKTGYEIIKTRRYRIKKQLVDYKGGKCEICGYDKCLSALDFHHINPEEKDFTISTFTNYHDIKTLKREVDKCVLVCANCHREIHAGLINIQPN